MTVAISPWVYEALSSAAVKVYGESAHLAVNASDVMTSPVAAIVNLSFTLAEPAVAPQYQVPKLNRSSAVDEAEDDLVVTAIP